MSYWDLVRKFRVIGACTADHSCTEVSGCNSICMAAGSAQLSTMLTQSCHDSDF